MARLAEPNANLALNPGDRFGLLTKSHGHGAVHVVLHSSAEGLGSKWGKSGIKCVYFSQNTNGLVFRGLIPALGECSYIIFKYMLTVLYKSLMWPSSALCLLLLVHLVCRDCKLFNWYLPKDLHLLGPSFLLWLYVLVHSSYQNSYKRCRYTAFSIHTPQ